MRRAGHPDRRAILATGAGLASALVLRPIEAAAASEAPAAHREATAAAIRRFAGAAEIRPGRVRLDLPPLVEDGNAVPLTIAVESPMSEADHVSRIAVFNEKNPEPNVITCHLGPRAGRAAVTTRIRMAGSQRITAVAEMSDGTFWSATADAVVTRAACTEG